MLSTTKDEAAFRTETNSGWSHSVVTRYAVAAACVLTTWAIRYFLTPVVGGRAAFIRFVPPALIAGWYGGVAPGIAALAAGLLLGEFFSFVPVQQSRPATATEFTLMLIYICTAAIEPGGLGETN